MSNTEKYVYSFGPSGTDGGAEMRNLLGGKGANLAEMTNLDLPVPAGFTIGTNVCTYYYAHEESFPPELRKLVDEAIAKIEREMGAKFGSTDNPLLVSCRSGARESMPGMMDTVLNIGLNDQTVEGLARQSGNERFAWDSYRRFVQMYGDVVLDMKARPRSVRGAAGGEEEEGGSRGRLRADGRTVEGIGGRVQEDDQGQHGRRLSERTDGPNLGGHRRRVR